MRPNNLALITDFYEFTMAACYYQKKMFAPATFSLFIREYPPNRGYFVSAGLEDVLEFLESFHFNQEDLDYLDSLSFFSKDFLHYLSTLRFTGDVFAIPEGRLFFKDEPILEITAPIIEAQLVETFVMNAINLQVTIATKAARCVHAAKGKKLVDFSLRRTQGIDAGLKVARASYIAGFIGTSNVLAGKLYNIPVFGTMAHSFVTSFEREIDAFRAFAEMFPEDTVFLIDTYDTIIGAHKAAIVGKEMLNRGKKLKGVRLDSGDMASLSKEVKAIFKEAGLNDISIFASGGFDEYKIANVIEEGAEIDAFGVGTKMGVSADAPYADIAYKLVNYDGRPVLKLSTGKRTLVGEKQVFRITDGNSLKKDIIALRDEELEGEPLLKPVMKKGKRLQSSPSLNEIRERFQLEFSMLDDTYKRLVNPETFPVELGPKLEALQKQVIFKVREKELGES
ncbi:MAG TPA: nicotinate phosphoribosyltransferase [Candidatus Desulfofervidus auxilii]|uniref:Nicotinate phosphoribosyltransferase n=1 Tax=Desulfofervidus auxilii TaxID=1621989 RepID=A0A7C0YBL2_DESA2|nr:nicotinate phosphoribosyltransferase [Candidatus Desulfofervidus auxilii]